MKKIEVFGLETIPKIRQGDNLAEIIFSAAQKEIGGLQKKDIIVITSKIVSKAQGRLRRMADVIPGEKALYISKKTGKDAKWLQLIFDQEDEILAIVPLKGIVQRHLVETSKNPEITKQLVEHEKAICITLGKNGHLHTSDGGIDGSNLEKGIVCLLPQDPDQAARDIRMELQKKSGKVLSVIIADTELVSSGTMDFAIGSSGIDPLLKQFGQQDIFGNPKFGGLEMVADELCSASALVFGQTSAGIPVALIRGYEYEINEKAGVSDMLIFNKYRKDIHEAIRESITATSYSKPFFKRMLLQIASKIPFYKLFIK